MTQTTPKSNRGPAAAPANRAALLGAAKHLFAERGYNVPLSAIARAAGVGQGVLYRHFPTRLQLALAVFEEHFEHYTRLAQAREPEAFFALWRAIIDNLIAETTFVDMAIDARESRSEYDGLARLLNLLDGPRERAVSAGLLAADVTLAEIALAIRMAYGIIRTAGVAPAADLRRTILGAFPRLLGRARHVQD